MQILHSSRLCQNLSSLILIHVVALLSQWCTCINLLCINLVYKNKGNKKQHCSYRYQPEASLLTHWLKIARKMCLILLDTWEPGLELLNLKSEAYKENTRNCLRGCLKTALMVCDLCIYLLTAIDFVKNSTNIDHQSDLFFNKLKGRMHKMGCIHLLKF